jgi:hypothetical protein
VADVKDDNAVQQVANLCVKKHHAHRTVIKFPISTYPGGPEQFKSQFNTIEADGRPTW